MERVSSGDAQIPPEGPMRVVVAEDEHGDSKLELIEGAFEQSYRMSGGHAEVLFLALSRQRGHLPYRRARQHAGTVCVRATLSEHEALWSAFLELDRRLGAQLAEVTLTFVREHVQRRDE